MLIKNFEKLASSDGRKAVLAIVEAGLEAIEPEKILNLKFEILNSKLKISDKEFDFEYFQRVFLVGFGKGAAGISKIIEGKLGERLADGWVIDASPVEFRKIKFTLGTHPLPSEINVNFTREMLRQLSSLTDRDLVLVVVCGGGSAMLTDPTVPLEQLIEKNRELLRSGKDIAQINEERRKLDAVKGGGLARRLSPAAVVGLVFSDVPGNDLAVIASGPTYDPRAENILMVSNLTALAAMKEKAEELGYGAEIVTDRMTGEAREFFNKFNETVTQLNNEKVWLFGGETTVTVLGDGQGGRNQELVLGALQEMSNRQLAMGNKLDTKATKQLSNLTICAVDSDGWDNGPAAGAIGDRMTVEKAGSLNLKIEEFLSDNDSYSFFQKTGDDIETGRLTMNVSDLVCLLSYS